MKQRILLSGSDGLDLLQRISTIEIKRLSVNPGLILNPQGKIMAYFEAKKLSDDSLEIIGTEKFLALLDQYTFGEKYTLKTEPAEDGTSLLNQYTHEKERIEKLIPKPGKEFQEDGNTNPLEVNLHLAIHENKGCYPGQEVIEKIISLGSPPRKLGLLSAVSSGAAVPPSVPVPATLVDTGNLEAGTLTSFSDGVALAILKRTHQKTGIKLHTSSPNEPIEFELRQMQT